MTQTLASANVSAAVLAAAAELASRRILACLLPIRPPQTLPNWSGLRKRHRRRKTAPGPWNRRQPRGDIRAVVMPAATAKHPGNHTQAYNGRYNSKSH
jgi:hypothetical protein